MQNQKFFSEMKEKYGTDLENLVYYCGEVQNFGTGVVFLTRVRRTIS